MAVVHLPVTYTGIVSIEIPDEVPEQRREAVADKLLQHLLKGRFSWDAAEIRRFLERYFTNEISPAGRYQVHVPFNGGSWWIIECRAGNDMASQAVYEALSRLHKHLCRLLAELRRPEQRDVNGPDDVAFAEAALQAIESRLAAGVRDELTSARQRYGLPATLEPTIAP